ncbi:MAG TPA: TlpA disulfide reductase family protein [Candidatus Limnocylindria bacterium]|nr:TlpA disulfide reductase family protein [Candidatus Limnocylindria bacterium]
MRSPIIIGAVAALAVGSLLLVILLGSAVGAPPRLPSPTMPSPPPIALPSPTMTDSPQPTASPGTPSPPAGSPDGSFEPPPLGVGLGEQAPIVRLPTLDGGTLDTSEYAGRPLWINFMATWCPQCIDELPMMELMQEQLGESMTLLLVDVGEDDELVQDFVDGLGVTLPVGLDRQAETQTEWGAWVLPMHFWIDSDGVVRSVLFGGAPRSVFIESILNLVPDAQLE